jgi:Flp pilus assembly pilin Flp
MFMTRTFVRILREDDGQDLIEYAILAALICMVCVMAIDAVGAAINGHYVASTATFAGS